MIDCPCDGVLICRYGWAWRAWCWALDICAECEQTFPYHMRTCASFGSSPLGKAEAKVGAREILNALEQHHEQRVRQINRDARLVWVLIVLIALAPEIIMIGRKLLR